MLTWQDCYVTHVLLLLSWQGQGVWFEGLMPTRQDSCVNHVLLLLSWQDEGCDLRVWMMTWQDYGGIFLTIMRYGCNKIVLNFV